MISDSKLLMMLHNIPECVILLASFCLGPCDPTLEFGIIRNLVEIKPLSFLLGLDSVSTHNVDSFSFISYLL